MAVQVSDSSSAHWANSGFGLSHGIMLCVNTNLQILREQLLQELRDIEAIAAGADAAAQTVALDQARVGRLSRMDAMQGQAIAQATNARRQIRAAGIRAALTRMQRGEYGQCLECGEAIASGRLQVNPAATLCIDCAEQADPGAAS